MIAPLIVIVGPTASGKSDFAMEIARRYKGEIICADSRTVYRGMDIGTAKPSREDRAEVPHHLVDIVAPNQLFTAADFKTLANQAINQVWARGRWPIMVGGSGLYIDAVLFDYSFGPPANQHMRTELNHKSVHELQAICVQNNIDLPENYLNKRYLIRAIEVGGSLQQKRTLRPNTIVVGLATEKATLLRRVTQRAQNMLRAGITQEVAVLGSRYGWEHEAMKGNIYRIFKAVVVGESSEEDAVNEVVKSDMRLIKKQLTWFKRNPYIEWGGIDELAQKIDSFVAAHRQ